jgi:restriction endonuclease S subunit
MSSGTLKSDEMPPGWATTTVGQAGAIRLGRQRSPDRHTGLYPTKYLRAANISAYGLDLTNVLEMDFSPTEREVFRLQVDDILLAEASGSASQVGRAAVWAGEIPNCCFQNTIIRFRPHTVVAPYALLVFQHFLESGLFAAAARGVGIQHLGAVRLAEVAFPLPPLPEQVRIAVEVNRRFEDLATAERALIAARSRTIEQSRIILTAAIAGTLTETEAALTERDGRSFQSAAAELDTLRSGRDPGRFLFGDDDEAALPIDNVPAGWTSAAVGEVGEVRLGRQRSPEHERGEHPTPYLRAANITHDGLSLDDVLQMNFTPEERKIYALQDGDILLAEASGSSSHVGRPAIWRGEISGCCYQNTVVRFRPTATLAQYALLVFQAFAESGVFARAARGVGIQHLGASRFSRLPFPLPPIAEQERIVAEAEVRLVASHAQRKAIDASLARFPALRLEVLSAAVHGRLVTQDPRDEPADRMLRRLGPPIEAARPKLTTTEEDAAVTKLAGRTARRKAQNIASLSEALADAQRPLSLPDLFAAAGYNRDSAGDVERFYLALRAEVGKSVQVAEPKNENATLELRDAS